MIRFRRLFDVTSDRDRRQVDAIRKVFAEAFPYDPSAGDRFIEEVMRLKKADYEPIVLIAEDDKHTVLGFAIAMYFQDIRFAYLIYIASDLGRPARGVGGAVYEALRELLDHKGAKGLFLDAGPDDVAKLKEPDLLAVNKKRMKFYERYGVFPIIGTLYDEIGNPKNEGYKISLLYDPLARKGSLRRTEAKQFLVRLYKAQYGQGPDDPYVRTILDSFKDDPVQLRPPRYVKSDQPSPITPGARLRPLKVIVAERHEIHHMREKGYVERPVRMRAVLRGLEELPVEYFRPRNFPDERVTEVHDPRLVAFLKAISEKLPPKRILYPEVFPIRRADRVPRELDSRAGYFCIDTFTPLTSNVWKAARAAANAAMTAAEMVAEGERFAYALVRPPGHHAERRVYGGFCYLNNTALAAHRLSKLGKVAVIDVDYHHGNGTQDIFYARNDVYTLSIHGTPTLAYPHFAGFEDERGEGEGEGFNRNFPLRRGATDARYLEVLDEALSVIRRFRPDFLVIALGYDLMRGDPSGSFMITTAGMREIGSRFGKLGLPILVVQEGGYSIHNLRFGAKAFFGGLSAGLY